MSHGALPHVVSIGICRPLGDIAATFDSGQLKVERSRNPAGDDLLQFKTVGKLKLKPLGPEGDRGSDIDELCIGLHPRSDPLVAADTADAELPPDFPRVDRLVLIGESGDPCNGPDTRNFGQIGRDT